ncbi:MAG: suppressor of fused domain protein [Phycisphaerae bacterium]|nr:suppressor of fused domain protein [Phycisphaerae bacterium]
MNTLLQQYFNCLDSLTDCLEPQCYEIIGSEDPPRLLVISYTDIPEVQHTTAFTYGLSCIDKPEWLYGRPEILISVKSQDNAWALAMGDIVKRTRYTSLFEYGTILDFGEKISTDSEMSCFFIFANSLLEQEDSKVMLSNQLINFVQLYPIYKEEVPILRKKGIEEFFFKTDIDFYNVQRQPFKS